MMVVGTDSPRRLGFCRVAVAALISPDGLAALASRDTVRCAERSSQALARRDSMLGEGVGPVASYA